MIDRANELQRQAGKSRFVGLVSLFVMCALFAAIIANALWATAQRRKAETLHVHTLDVLLIAGRLETELNAALRGERGYLITRDRDFLQPYFAGRARSFALARRLRAMTRDNPAQRRSLADFDEKLRDFFATLAHLVALEESGRHDEAVTAVRNRAGRDRIIELVAALHRIEAEEHRLLQQRRRATARADDWIEIYNVGVAVAGLLLMGLLIAAIVSAWRAHRHSHNLAGELHRLATTDTLTGLPNRRQLLAAMETELKRAARTGRPLALALLDVDRFKSVNDTHGHPAGDEVLRAIADELRQVTRAGDLLGRFGGEEFAILMPDTEAAQARRACERLRAAVARRTIHYPDGTAGRVTISTGVAMLAGSEEIAHLIARADAALYEAKTGGRNLVRLAA